LWAAFLGSPFALFLLPNDLEADDEGLSDALIGVGYEHGSEVPPCSVVCLEDCPKQGCEGHSRIGELFFEVGHERLSPATTQ